MMPITQAAGTGVLKTDPSLSVEDRVVYARAWRLPTAELRHRLDAPAAVERDHSVPSPARLIRRNEVAERLASSIRSVDRLAQQGILKKIRFPGRIRAIGFREADVIALIEGQSAGKRSAI